MENAFDSMRQSLQIAKEVNRACDVNVDRMLELCSGRLRHASSYELKKLKRELRSFNMHTGRWDSK